MNRRNTALAAAAVLGIGALALSGCAQANTAKTAAKAAPTAAIPTTGYTAASYSDVKAGGTLNLAVQDTPTQEGNWNLNTAEAAEVDVVNLEAPVTGGPVIFNKDGSWTVDKDYASSVKLISTSPQTVEVKLNPKAVWSDGSPITATDWQATFKALSGTNKAYDLASSAGYNDVASFDIKSPTDFTFTFKDAYADWPSMVENEVVPAAIANDPKAWSTGYVSKPLPADGPFIVSKVDNTANTVVETPNPNWWGEKPKLSQITFKAVDQSAQAQAFKNGELSAVEVDQDADAYAQAKTADNSLVERSGGLTWTQVTINGTSGPLADLQVRQAIGHAINRKLIAQAANAPVGAPAETQGNYVFMPGQAGYTDDADKYLAYSPAKAKSLLKADGWTDANGSWTKGGQTLKLAVIVPADTPTNQQRAEEVQSSLKAIDIPVTLTTVPSADYFNDIMSGQYQLATFSWAGTPFPISSDESLFYPAGKPGGSGQNYSYISEDSLGTQWSKANAELNPTKRNAMVAKIDATIAQEVPMVPFAPTPIVFVVDKGLVNYGPVEFQTIDWTQVGFKK